MVSHELRTPLNAVIGFSELIARELHGPIGDPRYAEHARLIRESGLTLLSLFNSVIDLARLEQGAMELTLRPEPLEEIVAEALADAAPAAAAREVRLVRMLDADADRVVCDRRGLRKVLGALLSNAVAASPAGAAVTLTTRRRTERVFLEVRDDGPGLDPADIPRLMRPFEQGENALVRRCEGAGLGLPIARLLSREMGGRLHLEAELGAGVRATVRLPAPYADEA
jgi:signal transduction histidine kinase